MRDILEFGAGRLLDGAMGEEGTDVVGAEDDVDRGSGGEVNEDPIKALSPAVVVVFSEDEMNEEPLEALCIDIHARVSITGKDEDEMNEELLENRGIGVGISTPIVVIASNPPGTSTSVSFEQSQSSQQKEVPPQGLYLPEDIR